MKTIFDTCTPRPDVLRGELTEDMFAARLRDVIEGNAEPVYQDPSRFFENTYPTEGLRTLVREVLGRLSQKEATNSPFIRLETSFGGGKTHNLIALYHLASGGAVEEAGPTLPDDGKDYLPKDPWSVAGVVGSDMDPARGIHHGNVTTRTLWGELAWQLGRFGEGSEAAYARMREADQRLAAPGTQVLEEIVGERPTLIMLDEIARYLRTAKAIDTENKKSDLAEQTVAFLMTLIEFAASKPSVVVVLTLADSSDAFGNETDELRQELKEAQSVAARHERVITPTAETEISRIVTHRLFHSIDRHEGEKTAEKYRAYYRTLEEQGVDLPHQIHRAEYRQEMIQDYPFHPELLTTLNRKTTTIPSFQKTRGALRLLARVVRRMWEEKPEDAWLIASHHVDLGDDSILNDMTSRLQRPAFRQVAEADIVSPRPGAPAHAQNLDRRWTEAGKPPYARRIATTTFLHSLTQTSGTGVELSELLVAVLQPGDDPQLVLRSLSIALGEERGEAGTSFWFLHYDGRLYRFKTEPSLEKIVQDEIVNIGRVRARDELDERIRKVWKKGTFHPVYFPAEASELPDDAKEPKLVVIHYDAAAATANDPAPPDLVLKLFERSGTQEGYRIYKNSVLFLVADADQIDRMVDRVQRHMAIQRVVQDPGRLAEFVDQQKKKLKEMNGAAELDVRVAITRAYRYLYYPTTDTPATHQGLRRESLPAQDQGEVSTDQAGVVLRLLRQLEKVLTAEDPTLPAQYVKAKAWREDQESLTTEDLRREFAKRLGLKIVLDINQLKKTIQNGCKQGVWIYYDAEEQWGYGEKSPTPLVRFSEDAVLYTPQEARRVGIRVKGEEGASGPEPCPLCGQTPCVCGTQGEDDGPSTGLLSFTVEGAAGQVFQKIVDRFDDEGKDKIGSLVIKVEGAGKEAVADVRALGLAIPQIGKGEYWIEQRGSFEFQGEPREELSVTFQGGWDRYKRLKSTTDAFGEESSRASLSASLKILYENGLPLASPQFETMRDVFDGLDMGRLVITVTEHEPIGESVS
ncbi:DUF499 domain-containing protein [soil metagenome]